MLQKTRTLCRNGSDTEGEQGSCGWHEGSGVARHGEAHVRRTDAEGSDEDTQGSHREPSQARGGQEGSEEPGEGRLQG